MPSSEFAQEAITAFSGEPWAILEAVSRVPNRPGLYAIFGDERAWRDLLLDPAPESPLYVGKAEKSLAARDVADHFSMRPNAKPTTGRSTVRRSFAALLRDKLDLTAVPRNLDKPGHFTMYGLAEGGDERLSGWMRSRLGIAVWPAPPGMAVGLKDIELIVIGHFRPPMNLEGNPARSERLRRARAEMAAEASRWRP